MGRSFLFGNFFLLTHPFPPLPLTHLSSLSFFSSPCFSPHPPKSCDRASLCFSFSLFSYYTHDRASDNEGVTYNLLSSVFNFTQGFAITQILPHRTLADFALGKGMYVFSCSPSLPAIRFFCCFSVLLPPLLVLLPLIFFSGCFLLPRTLPSSFSLSISPSSPSPLSFPPRLPSTLPPLSSPSPLSHAC